jgi:hypothetical protein
VVGVCLVEPPAKIDDLLVGVLKPGAQLTQLALRRVAIMVACQVTDLHMTARRNWLIDPMQLSRLDQPTAGRNITRRGEDSSADRAQDSRPTFASSGPGLDEVE